jgi:CRISPR-associated endonuclease/helicase Cas3
MRFDDFFTAATGKAPYEYQLAFATAPVLPDLLEAPTGSGKTATAVLGWLWRRLHGTPEQRAEAGSRLVFCLPMRTLVEQTERAVRRWRENLQIGDEALRIHLLLGGAVDAQWEEHPDGDTILIGTQDQLLSRALMRGYAMSRYRWPMHFALLHNDCTWVMDEVQLMGVGATTAVQLQAFRERLKVCGPVKTVWMTATLAEGRLRTIDVRREFTRQPFVASEPSLQQRLHAKKTLTRAAAPSGKSGSLGNLAVEIAAAHVPGTLTLVIVNRVARAQELSGLLASIPEVEATALVHSRFRPADRRRIQDAALRGSFHGVLVATQAIEAGVDLSAKTLFTELAPWPSLVQRFGRLNRGGEHDHSRAIWIDLDTDDDGMCQPYEGSPLAIARDRLTHLDDVSPASVAEVARDPEEPSLPVLRQKDLLELFDTEPDLAGHDIDVSRYIRATDDRDIQVAWRVLGNEPPAADAPDLHRDELCSVPFYDLKKLATKEYRIWRFDGLHKKWTGVEADRLFPGLTVVVDVAVGGYNNEKGFTRDKRDVPNSLEAPGNPPGDDESDRLSYGASEYVKLRLHSEDIVEEMGLLLSKLAVPLALRAEEELLLDAARWHDVGKAHPEFQRMLTANLPVEDLRKGGGPWAKSDGKSRARNSRRFFRHELASALAWLAAGKSDLGGFIVAAHHGKVRLSLRARPGEQLPSGAASIRFANGIHEGDVLPAVDLGADTVVPEQMLSLACMELGGGGQGASWADRMLRLLEEHGPFRLAYLEMLMRVADWRASQKRAPKKPAATNPESNHD